MIAALHSEMRQLNDERVMPTRFRTQSSPSPPPLFHSPPELDGCDQLDCDCDRSHALLPVHVPDGPINSQREDCEGGREAEASRSRRLIVIIIVIVVVVVTVCVAIVHHCRNRRRP